ncbi:bifunctional diguanylate cyclase/phosphodiesterase [Exiguobacterium sp. B203-G5 25_7]|uniref:putative bifunctional diguanylate cyclase/phosphodiesterase n=1 Tax=Exiguobacterium sp. R-39 TaxID=3416708 RepID=UPI00104A7615
MPKNKSYPFLLTTGIGLLFWYGNNFFEASQWNALVLLNIIQFLVGLLSTFWIARAYYRSHPSLKQFWLFLSLATSMSATGTFIWIILLYFEQTMSFPTTSYLAWTGSYLFYFAALLNRLKKSSLGVSNATYLFNTMIYMITASSISYYYLLYPLYRIEQHSIWNIAFTFLFQLADLGILFFVITLFYLIQFNKKNHSLLFLVTGLSLQVLGDVLFAQMNMESGYKTGGIVDFIWTIALLFIGFTALFYKDEQNERDVPPATGPYLKKEFIFPYTSILILSILMMQSYEWNLNALSAGWIIIFLLVIVRQAFTVLKNNTLLLELKKTAYIDVLTGLGNRSAFKQETASLFNNKERSLSFILLQIDRIKIFNDAFGYQVGEQLIQEVSSRLKELDTMKVTIYRFSEDEFLLVLKNSSKSAIGKVKEHILMSLEDSFKLKDFELNIIAHGGITTFPDQSQTIEEVQLQTAEALSQAKQHGNHSFVFYDSELKSNVVRKLEMESHLRHAISQNQLTVYYQSKIDLKSGRIVGMEALLRWYHPKHGWISPIEFIPIAEESGLINEIGEWVIRTAAYQSKQLQLIGFDPLLLSVNVSALQFQNPYFCKMIHQIIQETQLDPQWLELEITESIVQNIQESVSILQQLRSLNIKTSIDDFGTGYSSLNVLEQLPIDTLKIDKSFIDRLTQNTSSPMVKTIIDLGLNLNLTIVAEGIETIEQKSQLESYGCMIGQGYLFSRPIDFDSFIHLLQNHPIPKEMSY